MGKSLRQAQTDTCIFNCKLYKLEGVVFLT